VTSGQKNDTKMDKGHYNALWKLFFHVLYFITQTTIVV
jgi:hypothetical protein